MMRALCMVCLVWGGAAAAAGVQRHQLPEALATADCVVLAPAKGLNSVLLPGAMAADQHILVADGVIQQVGSSLSGVTVDGATASWAGRSCAVIDTTGTTVTPGFIAAGNQLGLIEVSMEAASADANGAGAVRAGLRVVDGYNPRSTLVPVARVEGVTTAIIEPEGSTFAGQAAAVDLAGTSQAQAIVAPYVAQVASPSGSRGAALGALRDVLQEARDYAANPTAFLATRLRESGPSNADLIALKPVIDGNKPLIVSANRASDIEAFLRFAKEQRVKLVLRGAAEGWIVADALAQAKVPVILNPMVYGPGGFRQTHARPDNAKLLQEAGVKVVIGMGSSHNARLLRQRAGNAVREGLDHDAALRAITQAPAEVFNLANRGRIAKGAVANLVVWNGDPLELRTSAVRVLIGGQAVPLDTRQWQLMKRYQVLPGTPTSALTLPKPAR